MAPNRQQLRTGRLQRAFTLVEVMISVLLLGLMTLSLYAAFSYGFSVVQMTREDLRATQILAQRMEAVRLCTWGALSNCPITFVTTYDPVNGGGKGGGTVYTGTITTNPPAELPVVATYAPNVCLATATIWWTNTVGSRQIPHTRQMQTYIARYGLQNYIWGINPL